MYKSALFLTATFAAALTAGTAQAEDRWDEITDTAEGQTVYFHAWGGSDVINDYINWAAQRVQEEYGVNVQHVKVTETGNVVSQVLSEKTAGRDTDGAVDLVWINGENFAAMKNNDLLYGPFTQWLPNYQWVDTADKPTTLFDFTTPVENMEAPWGMAQLVFMYDSAEIGEPPTSMESLLDFARENPGRVTYPAPPSFYGTTFIKQTLLELADNRTPLYNPVDNADFDAVTAPLWDYLDQLHPLMWRRGQTFTSGAPEMKQLLNDGEIAISLSFNPNDASNAIATGELPETIRTYVHDDGSIGNTHFVAIPYNSGSAEGAMVLADFLMSPEAQARKANTDIWGDPTVLDVDRLPAEDRALFEALPQGKATLSADELGAVLREPHTSWVEALERAWQERYAN
ncbi:ABC transporter substrate-binding protein [Saccharospirillum salsuginis]|uniref:ABC transporter substrate-binding protein n=1 Tax=Saccharospirillum salsuginis TaxID=418750 RepID=A0A918K211_9GAMM|nr:ABC transporter substrate-binding protein [Saccharospirillum salsuginis]GGX41999.1 ABC transporter substrate-binding protein [Saccharospirillum salsuginis]